MGWEHNAVVCHKCPHRQRPPVAGFSPCTISGREIVEHARADVCPLGYFGRIQTLGDVVGRVVFYSRAVRLVGVWKRVTGLGCGCEWRKRWLDRFRLPNRLWRRITRGTPLERRP